VSHNIKEGAHSLTLFGRLDNVFDKKYVSSIVVNQQDRQYYEPGMPRNWILGVKYSLAMN
jgi:iron complex outermembrane receptor protein